MKKNEDLEKFFLDNNSVCDTIKTEPLLLNCPRSPQPLHGVAPREIKGQTWWDETRKKAYFDAGLCCQACGVSKFNEGILWKNQLHAHEFYTIDYEQCVMRLEKIVALCEACHYFIHDGRSHALFDNGEYDLETMFLIIRRGLQVLGKPNKEIHELANEEYYVKTWDKWYLEFEGKKYYSRFKNIDEWKEFYGRKEKG